MTMKRRREKRKKKSAILAQQPNCVPSTQGSQKQKGGVFVPHRLVESAPGWRSGRGGRRVKGRLEKRQKGNWGGSKRSRSAAGNVLEKKKMEVHAPLKVSESDEK